MQPIRDFDFRRPLFILMAGIGLSTIIVALGLISPVTGNLRNMDIQKIQLMITALSVLLITGIYLVLNHFKDTGVFESLDNRVEWLYSLFGSIMATAALGYIIRLHIDYFPDSVMHGLPRSGGFLIFLGMVPVIFVLVVYSLIYPLKDSNWPKVAYTLLSSSGMLLIIVYLLLIMLGGIGR